MKLKKITGLSFSLALLIVSAMAQAGDGLKLPETSAGRRLSAFVSAFNTGDLKAMRDFHQNNDSEGVLAGGVEGMLEQDKQMQQELGTFAVRKILDSSEHAVEAVLQASKGQWFKIRLTVEAQPPNKIIGIGLEPTDPVDGKKPGATAGASPAQAPAAGRAAEDMTVDAKMREEVIEGAIKNLNDYYVFPDVAKQMEKALRDRVQRKEYDSVTSARAFAEMLTGHLREVSRDKHLRVVFRANPIPERRPGSEPSPEEIQEFQNSMKAANWGFEKVERLEGNVGYLDLRGFYDATSGGDTVAAAMNFLANTDSLIIDLRKNGGGSPAMVALISSYLFEGDPVHLNDIYWRPDNSTRQWWTLPYVPGKRYGKKDVYVLTSGTTFSAAEEFTYNLKNLKRATIVGETTGGGAHPGGPRRINAHFMVGVPQGRAINPISKTNWEGTGVKPDVETSADKALKTAHLLALRKAVEAKSNPAQKARIMQTIATLEKETKETGEQKGSQ
ncbi:MAG TPA: S41 family peptidase [Blastocatellia bacterium]|nr:S41 family peptidase [Blastocatellia bacterium]